jgi:hypothetical protein
VTPAAGVRAQGRDFVDICAQTDLFEGSIIRATRRLDELMGELGSAARIIGDPFYLFFSPVGAQQYTGHCRVCMQG